jgi:DNA-binding HxlR family transcriptional regulator
MKLEKVTKRSYDDACGTAHALDLIGERWALLVIRELMLGPKRFSDLRADLPGISANVLTQRLEGLEAAGILAKRKLPPPASAQVYELTEWGYEAEPIIQSMGRWAARSPVHDTSLPLSATSLMLSFRTMFQVERAAGVEVRIGFRFGGEALTATVSDGRLQAERGDPAGADAIVTGTPEAMAAVVYGGQPLAAMEVAGALRVEGDRAAIDRFITLFALPPKVGA